MEHAKDLYLTVKKNNVNDKIIALTGNPNVGKSTVFNQLTGLKQHTGNWPGKTVNSAQGYCTYKQSSFVLVDLPGSYSLIAHSAEEMCARDFICSGNYDAVIIVCDATCLERNLNLVLQTIEITPFVVVCVNLMDEAEKKKINVDINGFSKQLGVPVVGCAARSKTGLNELMEAVNKVSHLKNTPDTIKIRYPDYIEDTVSILEPIITEIFGHKKNARRTSLSMIRKICEIDDFGQTDSNEQSLTFYPTDKNESKNESIMNYEQVDKSKLVDYTDAIKENFLINGITEKKIEEDIVSVLIKTAEEVANTVVSFENEAYKESDINIDRILTGRFTAFPIMLIALLGVFWLTITGANYPSELISNLLFLVEDKLLNFFINANAPKLLYEPLVLGIYRVMAWVVSVMLPPMALFFPLFTLLEDVGFLPRVAFNLDKHFKKSCACGKQALTMWIVNNRIFPVDISAKFRRFLNIFKLCTL